MILGTVVNGVRSLSRLGIADIGGFLFPAEVSIFGRRYVIVQISVFKNDVVQSIRIKRIRGT